MQTVNKNDYYMSWLPYFNCNYFPCKSLSARLKTTVSKISKINSCSRTAEDEKS